jgi:hypothetical protein
MRTVRCLRTANRIRKLPEAMSSGTVRPPAHSPPAAVDPIRPLLRPEPLSSQAATDFTTRPFSIRWQRRYGALVHAFSATRAGARDASKHHEGPPAPSMPDHATRLPHGLLVVRESNLKTCCSLSSATKECVQHREPRCRRSRECIHRLAAPSLPLCVRLGTASCRAGCGPLTPLVVAR